MELLLKKNYIKWKFVKIVILQWDYYAIVWNFTILFIVGWTLVVFVCWDYVSSMIILHLNLAPHGTELPESVELGQWEHW